MTDWTVAAAFWGFLLLYGGVMYVVSPKAASLQTFFQGTDAAGRPVTEWWLTASVFISWIFAKSVTNAANLGASYGAVGSLAYAWANRAGAVINNGSAGMPNFRGDPRGLITRISAEPAADALYGVECRGVHCQAVAVGYDTEAWRRRFLAWWPAGSPAHESYYQRIRHGPAFSPAQAARGVMRV